MFVVLLVQQCLERVGFRPEHLGRLALGLVAVAGGIRFLELVIAQRNDEFLAGKVHPLESQVGVGPPEGVVLEIGCAAEQVEGQVVLGLGESHPGRVGHGHGDVSPAGAVVIDHHVPHHSAGLVLVADAQDVAFDAVVEGARRDFDFVLGAPDVVAQRENLVVGDGHELVSDEVGAD